MPNAKTPLTPAQLRAAGWTLWDGTATNPAKDLRVRVITRGGRQAHAMSEQFWWGRARYDPPTGKLWPKDWPMHPANAGRPSTQKRIQNEVIAYKLDPYYPRNKRLTQFSGNPELVDDYRDLP